MGGMTPYSLGRLAKPSLQERIIMSREAIMDIIERASKDESFRQLLFSNPKEALDGYDLSPEERKTLENLDEESFDDFAGDLGDRSTKGFVPGTGIR
jgi:hypothetical protein